MAHIDYIGTSAIVEMPDVSFTYQVSENPRDFDSLRDSNNSLNWNNNHNYLGDYIVQSFGSNNDLPWDIKEVVQNNYIAPGLLTRKTELLWGLGPRLYTEVIEEGKIVRKFVSNPTIDKWLKSWDFEGYLLACSTDYQVMQGVNTRIELNKGSRIGQPFINKLHHIAPDKARLGKLRTAAKDARPTHAIITDWHFSHVSAVADAKIYPLFDYTKPFAYPNSVHYSNMYSFCTDYYTLPNIYGSLEWLKRSTAVPLIFKALSKNSINLKYHIISPMKYWEDKRGQIKDNCNKKGITYNEGMLTDFQADFLNKIGEVLSGDEKHGKFLHTSLDITVDGNNLIQHGWEIKVIDQKSKDFVESQIKISERADIALSAGIGINQVLGNSVSGGGSNGGSEQIYSLINYLNTGVDIQEMIICKSLNYAIEANYPESNVKIGFYHNVPETQAQTAPADRSRNNAEIKK